ncbi:phage tail tape measure protein [Bombilactobacillus folatiphilus]|uniref:Phage tail tape measure protein n=1 Tax=Bombilactobacillus folatiphilus TaxID=2923362 RepID=A0ABY4PA78_9LACO|nr:phage tail tape measure protein [Bombilactobacillus folatiphilus]UQS82609.1 phage tail tape measure protein [Bombilactobacillus folatiphilus]
MPETYSVKAVLSAVDSGFNSTVNSAVGSLNKLSKQSGLSANGIGKSMTVAGAAITAMAASSVKGFGDFQKSINQAAVIAGGSSKDIKALSDEANKLGQTLPISAQEAADAMIEMAKNGASVKDLKDDFPPIAKAAAATGEDLSSTASVVQQSMNLWGGGMKNATMYSAILAETANKSNATIGDMQQVLADVGGTAVNMGMDLKTLSTAVGILTNSGIPAAQASMDLNHALTAMEAPSKIAKGEMTALGLSFTDAQGNMKPFPQILQEIASATDGMGESQKAAALKTMFGTAGMNAMLPLLKSVNGEAKNGNVDWNILSSALDNAGGSFQTASAYLDSSTQQMQQNLGSRIDQMKDAFTGLQNTAMASTSGMVSGVVNALDNMFTHMQTSNDGISQLARGFIGLAPVIGPAVTAVGGFLTSADRIKSTLVDAANWLVSPWGLATVAIGLVVGALAGLYQNFTPFKTAVDNTVAAFQQGFGQAMPVVLQSFQGLISNLKGDLEQIGSAIRDQLGGSLQSIDAQTAATNIENAFNGIIGVIQNVVGAITKMVTAFINTGAIQSVWGAIKSVIGAVVDVIKNVINNINNLININGSIEALSGVWSIFGTAIGDIVKVIGNAVSGITDFIKKVSSIPEVMTPLLAGGSAILGVTALSKGFELLKTGVDKAKLAIVGVKSAIDTIKTAWVAFNAILEANVLMIIVTAIAAVVAALVAFFTKTQTGQEIWQSFTTFLSGIWNTLVQTAQTVFGALGSFFSDLWNGIVSVAQTIWNGLAQFFQTIWNGDVAIATTIWNGLSNFFSGLWNGIVSVATNAWNTFSGGLSQIWNGIIDIAKGIWGLIKDAVMSPVLIVIDLVTGNFKQLGSDVQLIWNTIKDSANTIWNGIKSVITGLVTTTVNIIKSAWTGFKSFINAIWTGIKTIGSNIWNGIKSSLTSIQKGTVSASKNIWNGLKNFINSFLNTIKTLWKNGFNAIKSTIVNIANAMTSGAKKAWNGLKSGATWIVDQVKNAFNAMKHINLFDIGKSIIKGFLNGLKNAFNDVKNFIGGIGDWIRKHKGPIQYDRKLLIPAGNAIMNGLNNGLVDSFKSVQTNVSGMAKQIAEAANTDFSKNINDFNTNLAANNSIDHFVSGSIDINRQPMQLSLKLGDTTYGAFVDDISKQQDINLSLSRFGA